MAILAIGIVGAGIGSSVGMTALGFGLGTAIGSLLFPGNEPNSAKPEDGKLRITDNVLQTSSYGAYMAVGYGLYKVSGNVIWATPIEEVTEETTNSTLSSGKGIGGDGDTRAPIISARTFFRSSIAVAFAEVPQHRLEPVVYNTTQESQEDGDMVNITERKSFVGIRRLWLNNYLVRDGRSSQFEPPSILNVEEYLGDESQVPSPIIQSFDGVNNVPAYRGACYVVIPNLDLTPFGNTLPSASAELYERADRIDDLEEGVEGLALSPDEKYLWVTSHTKRVVQKVDTKTLEVVARIGRDTQDPNEYLGLLPAHPWRCATSLDGAYVWVVHKGAKKLTRITVSDNTWVSYDVDKKYATDVAVDGSGNVWVTYPFYDKVTKYNSSGVKQLDITIYSAPWCIGYDREYNYLWVSTNKSVDRINPIDNTTFSLNLGGNSTLSSGPDRGRYFHSDQAFVRRNSDMWVATTGNDVATIINRTGFLPSYDPSYRRTRNVPTYPTGADCNYNDIPDFIPNVPNDPTRGYGTIYISGFAGNRLRAFSYQARGHLNAGTIAFPGQCVAMPDGKCFVTNTRLGIVQRIDTR
jgi:hypothetical protein